MIKKTIVSSLAIVGIAFGLVACAQPELPQDHYYRLNVSANTMAAVKLSGVLEVERFRADGLISGRPIAYSETQGHLAEYNYHFWVEPPVDLLQDAMVTFLRNANLADHVVTPDMRMSEDYLLTGKIKRLERNLIDGNQVSVEIEIGLKQSADDKILVLKTYARTLKQSGDTVQGAVDAMNVAISEIYTEFLTDVRP